jgi:chromosome segregation protein
VEKGKPCEGWVLKLRKVDLQGFKSFFEKTPITFSGSGITCIVGPNGCGKSNVVDAVSWVLGEQSHKMLRAERMSDCIFNGTAKRPPLGMAEVTLTLVDPELSEAVAKVIDMPEEDVPATGESSEGEAQAAADGFTEAAGDPAADGGSAEAEEADKKTKKRRGHKPAIRLKPGEVVVSRRLYRSGQSEYLINGRVARLRDIQEIFMGVGLGPDSYAIIEQGRIGQILNSKPMDRRAIIEEAAGVTMYKTKRRLSEAKLEASKLNLSRVNDIFVEVEKQLASLKRQASKARRYAELREQMRGLLRIMLASKAEHLDIEAARLQTLLRDMEAAEGREASTLHELEGEQERLHARSYTLDGELRQNQNVLNQTELSLQSCENRITFNYEQVAQLESRATRLSAEIEQAEGAAAELGNRVEGQRTSVTTLREQTTGLEAGLREVTERASGSVAERESLEARVEELRQMAARLIEESAREQAESVQAEEAAARHSAAEEQRTAALREMEAESSALSEAVRNADAAFEQAETRAQQLGEAVREAQANLVELRRTHQEMGQALDLTREGLSAERARRSSIDQILSERAYTADAVQKLFNASGENQGRDFRAVGLLADYAEVEEKYEAAIEQFLREELEYVVVESFEHARAGVALLREEMGGRATFFVDSLSKLNLDLNALANEEPLETGMIARLDKLVEFREPLGAAAKYFLWRLRTAYIVESAEIAERMAHANPQGYFLTADGTCYHGRMVSGGRQGEAGPLALKRELRQHESEANRLEKIAQEQQAEVARLEAAIAEGDLRLASAMAEHMEAQKSLVAATHQREQARTEFRRVDVRLASEREEIARLQEQAEAARTRAERARNRHAEALRSREAAEAGSAEASEKLARLRHDFQVLQERVVARREELATMSERLASAEAVERRLAEDLAQSTERIGVVRQQHAALLQEQATLQTACEELAVQVENLRGDKTRLQEERIALETEWEASRARVSAIDEALRGKRQSLEELRAERSQRQIEKARNDADRDYLRQTCIAELNAQPEELIAVESELLVGEHLVAAETNYNEMKARAEAMGPVNMMALDEYRECEQREEFLRRERDDLVQSIENTQMTINELDQVSRQKFEEAFAFINAHFAIAFQSLFGGGTGEMRLGEPDSSGEAGIDIAAQPPGKRLQNVLLLSGGEKALTALALLIAVFRFRPSPFCILDEVDAPLDEANVGRFNKMLREMCGQTQFIVVTHNRRTMEMGSVLYGVTMQEPGVSKLVSVKWEDAETAALPKTAAAASSAA